MQQLTACRHCGNETTGLQGLDDDGSHRLCPEPVRFVSRADGSSAQVFFHRGHYLWAVVYSGDAGSKAYTFHADETTALRALAAWGS